MEGAEASATFLVCVWVVGFMAVDIMNERHPRHPPLSSCSGNVAIQYVAVTKVYREAMMWLSSKGKRSGSQLAHSSSISLEPALGMCANDTR